MKILLLALMTIFIFGAATTVYASEHSNTSVYSVLLDRDVYPVPFGGISDFEDTLSSRPDGRSLFPVHHSAITSGNMQEKHTLGRGDLMLHIRIQDSEFNISSQGTDKISQDVPGTGVGPLKISVSRDSQTIVLAYAGGNTPNPSGVIDVGDDNPDNARQLGSIFEIHPESGLFELDFAVRYTDGPSNSRCPATASFTALNYNAAAGSEESRFDVLSPANENYCIMKGDILTVEYTKIDSLGNIIDVLTDSATFEMRDALLKSDKSMYTIGSDMILTLTDLDLDLDNDVPEKYDLDLIEWDSDAARLTLGDLGGEESSFDPKPAEFRETGDSTGIFQVVIEIPEKLHGDYLDRGEEILLEYTDWSPSGAQYVGQEDEDINITLFTSNFGATAELDKKTYTWTDKVYITIVAKDHDFDSDLIDEIGETEHDPVMISTGSFILDKYKLVETGVDTGIFTGEIDLAGFSHDADGNSSTGINGNDIVGTNSSGSGPYDGLLPSSVPDNLTVSYEFSEDQTVIASALIHWNEASIEWLRDSYPVGGTGVVRITDIDMNLNPDRIDNFDIDVWSDSDAEGIYLKVTETGDATGIFEGTVFFTTTDESSGHRLRVIEGDTLTAEYEDNTLPEPFTPADEIDITAKSMIQELPPSPLKQQMSGVLPGDVECKIGLERKFSGLMVLQLV